MAAVDPYSPCPCGSGQKFKWCCHKVEALAERAQRLFDSGQAEAALKVLDEGLRKEPDNAWLLTRKAVYHARQNQPEESKASLRRVLAKNPGHFGASALLTRLILETEGPAAGAAQFQQVLALSAPDDRNSVASLARIVGVVLSESGQYAAALKHLELVPILLGRDGDTASSVRMIESSPRVPTVLKNPYKLSPPPAGLPDEARARFEEALRLAGQGRWLSASSAFELLSGEPAASAEADRNLGLCRLWLADDAGAVEALRRSVARSGATIEAVDLEGLCQQIAPPGPDDQVEMVQLIWPLRDREALLKTLREDRGVDEEEPGPIDPDDPDSPEVDHFAILDRPAPDRTDGLRVEEIPKVVGRILLGQEIAALETYDDGRLDGLSERFTALAGASIARAHPKTKVLDKVARTTLALSWEWRLPAEVDDLEAVRLDKEQGARLIREVWPNTPLPALGGRTPLQAGRAGDAVVPLRAAVMQLEQSRETWRELVDFAALRTQLGIEPEPPIDPETVDIEALHLARLATVPADRVDDERLAALYRRARRAMLLDALEQSARALIERPAARERAGIELATVYSDLVMLTARRGNADEAFEWVRRGRQADPAAKRAANAPMWDMLEVRLKAQTREPQEWAPDLAVILDRYSQDQAANTLVVLNLVEMGLVQMVPNPDQPDDILMDSRPLQMLMAEYGPRVTTASGRLGVSATKGGIWTPGQESGGGGAIWTPGADAGATKPGQGKSNLIIPGR